MGRFTRAGVALTVGIIILAALIVAGFMWAKHSGEVARHEETVKIATAQLEDDSNEVAVSGQDDTAKDEAKDDKSSSEAPAQDESTKDAPTTVTELPRTGPASTFMTLLAIGATTFAAVSYLRSPRAVAQ